MVFCIPVSRASGDGATDSYLCPVVYHRIWDTLRLEFQRVAFNDDGGTEQWRLADRTADDVCYECSGGRDFIRLPPGRDVFVVCWNPDSGRE